jgi:beta-glucosidase-like glycosyl hydrolase
LSALYADPFAEGLFRAAAVDGDAILDGLDHWTDVEQLDTGETGASRLFAHVAWRKRWVMDRVRRHLQAGVDQVVAKATGEAQRFEKLLAEYQQAEKVTRDRLYIDALEAVLSNASKIMVDVEGGNNMMYLPLDQLTRRTSEGSIQIDQSAVDQAVERILREVNAARSNNSRIRGN